MELEALEAILMDDLEEYEGMLPPDWTSHGQTYKVHIRPTDDGTGEEGAAGDDELGLELLFARECGGGCLVGWGRGCVCLCGAASVRRN